MNMTKSAFLFVLLLFSVRAFGQTDTIFSNNEKIPCIVKVIKESSVVYVHPGEELLNSIYKNAVQKIVFKNGRVQVFAEATSFNAVKGVDDYEKVTVTAVESEVKGLFKVGDVSAKAVGTTELSNQERVKNRAYRKLKMVAAMMGANAVYLTNQRTEGNKIGYFSSSSAETNLTGVAYTNRLPDFNAFKELLDRHKGKMTQVLEVSLGGSSTEYAKFKTNKPFTIENLTGENGLIVIDDKYRVVGFDQQGFNVYYRNKSKWFNVRVDFGE